MADTHHWARQLQQCGQQVRLLPAHDVHHYVRRNKTDRGDAKQLLEAARNDEIRPVPVKTVDQQMIASLHRVRSTWLATRTARLNTIRGPLREFGVVIPVGAQHVVPKVRTLADDVRMPPLWQPVLATMADEIRLCALLLIHGGRSVLWSAKGKAATNGLRAWALHTEQRRGHNVAAVAVVNKLARIRLGRPEPSLAVRGRPATA